MATSRPRSPLIAVDTNVTLDLAEGKEHVLDALDVIRRRLKPSRFLATPTVFQELVFMASESDSEFECDHAARALRGLAGWNIDLVNLVPVGHGIVELIADMLQQTKLITTAEYNDGLILAEAALLGCAVLLTGDGHLRGMEFQRAALELKKFEVEMPVIATPREIVAKFF
jgi:predicted nucleic acid-binding protein